MLKYYGNLNAEKADDPLVLKHDFKSMALWGAWVAQSVKFPTSAQVMISILEFKALSPALCRKLRAWSLLQILCLPLSLLPPLLTLSLSKVNKH